ncbi:winged helix-turn-helix transcriptional regulator [Streptomyces sp. NPDC091266]|uniref:winged helix-turn-helix transcriptional regulator n=1 Tax=Streptomyces sp. NPDC091266 TaxID=3365978 RepID=UPI00380B08E9
MLGTAVEQACPINPVVDLVFSRWTTPILWVLEHHGRLRFNALQRLVPSITPKVLTQRLRQLERDGMILRTYHAEIPPRVEYEISDLGPHPGTGLRHPRGLVRAHLPQVAAARRAYDTAREEEEAWAQG